MENSNFAAIDIGSNGARLLIKNVIEDAGGNYEFNKVLFLRIPLRLGKDVFTIGEISPERERMMMCMIKSYKQLMKLYRVVEYRACATSAMRDAANGQKILKKIRIFTSILTHNFETFSKISNFRRSSSYKMYSLDIPPSIKHQT